MSRVRNAADALAGMSMAATPGDYLGAEDELLVRLAISRPTLRQAAKIVEADRLIQVRRGAQGGFYAARPDAADAIRAPARYLRLNGATLADLHAVTRLLMEEVAALAARAEDGPFRGRLGDLRNAIGGGDGASETVRTEIMLARLLGQMSGNPAAELYLEIGYAFGLDEQHVRLYERPADRDAARRLQIALIDAVLARDPDIARLMARRRADLIGGWLAALGQRA